MVVVSVMNDVWQVFAKQLRKKAAGAGLGFSACNSCTKEWDLEIMGLWGSAGRVEWSMNQKSFLNNEVRHRKGFLFQKQPSSPSKWMFSRAVRPWVFHVQGLGSGGGWEIARTLCPRIKNKNKSALSQTEKSHQHPETDCDGPKDQAPSSAALLGSRGGWCCCPTPGVISWLAGEDRNGILQVRQHSFGKRLSLSLGTPLYLVKLLLVFISPSPVSNLAACHPGIAI